MPAKIHPSAAFDATLAGRADNVEVVTALSGATRSPDFSGTRLFSPSAFRGRVEKRFGRQTRRIFRNRRLLMHGHGPIAWLAPVDLKHGLRF
jgi:hypothetical protein